MNQLKRFNTIQASNTSSLVGEADYNAIICEIEKTILDQNHDKYITTQEFNKLTSENFAARLAQANLVAKADIDDFVEKRYFSNKLKNLNKKVTLNKTKNVETEKKLTDVINKVAQIPEKAMIFSWVEYILQVTMIIRISQFLPRCFVHYYWITIRKLLTGYQAEYHQKHLDHLILTWNRPCLIQPMLE